MASATQTAYGLYVADAVQRFGFGQRFLTNDGRVFKYARAGATLDVDHLAQSVVAQEIAYAAAPRAASAGDTKVSITVGASDGPSSNGALAADYLQGGYVVIFSDSVVTMLRQIVGNTVVASGGTSILTLDFPLNAAVATADSYLEAMASPYRSIKASTTGDTNRGFIGLPLVEATSGQHCWIQTWGPCWISPQADVGATGHSIQVVARYDGSIQEHENYSAGDTPTVSEYRNGVAQQHVGFVLSHATAGTQGAPFIMLQISI